MALVASPGSFAHALPVDSANAVREERLTHAGQPEERTEYVYDAADWLVEHSQPTPTGSRRTQYQLD